MGQFRSSGRFEKKAVVGRKKTLKKAHDRHSIILSKCLVDFL